MYRTDQIAVAPDPQSFFLGQISRDLDRHLGQCRHCSAGDQCADGHYLMRALDQLGDLIEQRSQR